MSITRRSGFALALGLAVLAVAGRAAADPVALLPVVTVGVQENGTVNWELQTIRARGLDHANGFRLEVLPFAGAQATQVAMLGGQVDAIVSDWFWVAMQRGAGAGLTFWPYSTSVGGVVVPEDSPVQELADLEGQAIGIAGGPLDKSWLILRALHRHQTGRDLAEVTQQVYGAPPIIQNAAETGEVAGAINFWHFSAKMQAAGMRQIATTAEAAETLGLSPDTPLLGYVFRDSWIEANPARAEGLARASRQAKEVLAADPAAWDELRPMMNAATDAEFEALRDGWLAGIPPEGPVDAEDAADLFALMAELGGDELTGGLEALPEGLFWQGE